MTAKGRTAVEKVFSRLTSKDVKAGDFVWAGPDLLMINDMVGFQISNFFKKIGSDKILFKGKSVFVYDHIYPPKDITSANNIITMHEFASHHDLTELPAGEGIEHTLLIERGIIKPGMFVVGSDSHTITSGAVGAYGAGLGTTDIGSLLAIGETWFKVPETMAVELHGKLRKWVTSKDIILKLISAIGVDGANYMAMDFTYQGDTHLGLDDRLAIANMAAETGAKSCSLPPDSGNDGYQTSDDDATISKSLGMDLEELEPLISLPHSPGNVKRVRDVEGTAVNQVYVGNCANGTLTDLKEVAEVLKHGHVKENVNMIIVPATRRIYKQAIESGLISIFLDAGATIAPPTCGACGGLHMGVLGRDQVCVSNTNRNFRGRMGDPSSKVYLANSYVAALAAVEGRITDPEGAL